ncbi:MAG TPA: hypothetical protein VLI06_19145 [Solimonas sp.]|nr:hypothetical protein [Solimonas sp.]
MKTTRLNFCLVLIAIFIGGSAFGAGPTGIGRLKLGLTKEAVEALKESDGVYLVSAMEPFENKYYQPAQGETRFTSEAVTPLLDSAAKITLTFQNSALTTIYIGLPDNSDMAFEKVKNQISSKYGNPTVMDERKEEQCIYKNGSNFKLMSGTIEYVWTDPLKDGARIETRLRILSIQMCPSSLRDERLNTSFRSLTIGRVLKTPTEPNPF